MFVFIRFSNTIYKGIIKTMFLSQVSASTKKKYCKLLHEITNHDLLSPEDNTDGEVVITYGQLEQDCLGAWCPHRRIPGLILIHAWNPNDMNTLTSDHVKCHFVRPPLPADRDREEVLEPETLYSIREFGELSEGETHWLCNNNPIHFSNGTAMMLTLDCGVVCGQVYDGLETGARCPHHSQRYPDFCMSSIKEEHVDLDHAAVCAAETGHVYIVAGDKKITGETGGDPRIGDHVSDGDACDTFQLVSPPETETTWLHSITACLKGNLYHLGGTSSLDGPRFGYIWCSFDLQEFHTRYTER